MTVDHTFRRRFFEKLRVDPATGCWVWQAAKLPKGYAILEYGEDRYAHRLAHKHFVGDIPEGYEIDHLCNNTSCVCPAHLEAVTQRENNLRSNSLSAQRARQTHCKNGHEFTPENTYLTRGVKRRCRTCHLAWMRARGV